MRFFVRKVYTGNRISQKFDETSRRFTKLEQNEISNNFAIAQDAIDRIAFYTHLIEGTLVLSIRGFDQRKNI